jgi:hypothetical protein
VIQASTIQQPQQVGHHKKNQYSTIVQSNYKNLVEGNQDSQTYDPRMKPIDLDVF